VLKVGRPAAFVADARTLGLLVQKLDVALRADALRLCLTGAAPELDVADATVVADMAGDWEIIDGPDGGWIFHFLR
jgi:hypothetical protein